MVVLRGGSTVVVLLVVLFAGAGSRAAAASPPGGAAGGADALTQQALQLRRDGEDEKAVVLFRQVYQQARSPRAAAQLGLCEQALGRWAEAEMYVTEGLRADDDPWVRKNRRTLESALGQIKLHVARIELVGEPPGAEVLVNGTATGHLPLAAPLHVTAGEVQLDLRAPGHAPATKLLTLVGGQYQKVVLRLQPTTHPGSLGRPEPTSMGAATGAGGTTRPPAGGSADSPGVDLASSQSHGVESGGANQDHSWRRAAKWIAWGGAAVAAGVGTYGALRNNTLVSEFDRGCGFEAGTGAIRSISGTSAMDVECVSLRGRYQTAAHLAVGGLVGAGLLGAAGLVLWLTEPDDHARGSASDIAAAHCAPVWTGRDLSIGCRFRF